MFRLFCALCALSVTFPQVRSFGCVDQDGTDVDWWIAYKLPRIHTASDPNVKDGLGYAYFSAKDVVEPRNPFFGSPSAGGVWVVREAATAGWKMSAVSVADPGSVMGRTLSPLYSSSSSRDFQLLYNDEFPNKTVSMTMGHTKGVVAVEGRTRRGFWLIHSVPHYPPDPVGGAGYGYPSTGHTYGQSFFCVSFGVGSVDDVGRQLVLNEPFVYRAQVSDWVEEDYPSLYNASQTSPHHQRKKGALVKEELLLTTSGGVKMASFAKSRDFGQDLYSDFVAPTLKTGLYSETWRHGEGVLGSNCSGSFSVVNVASVAFKAFGVDFSSEKDHSKWALSEDTADPWVCVGDINRASTQFVRGGGTLCMRNGAVWRWFKQIIEKSQDCPVGRS